MISSLTGFGRSEVQDGNLRYSIEIKSINSRFFEMSTRTPRSIASFDNDLRQKVKNRIARGKIFLHISEPRESIRTSKFGFDPEIVQGFVNQLRDVGQKTGLQDNLGLTDLISLSEWFSPEESDELTDKRMELVFQGLEAAIDDFIEMSREEGKNLANDLENRAHQIDKLVENIDDKASVNRESQLERLKERITKYLQMENLDQGRLEQEAVHIVDRIDITEEVVRMRSHIKQFLDSLKNGGLVGKRLNFLLQEMNREINTMGSKAAAPEISTWVVDAKEELEKIREQVQNVA